MDFVIIDGRTPIQLVECKWDDGRLDPNLRYLKAKFPGADARKIAATGTKDFVQLEGLCVAPALALLGTLT